MKNKKLSMVTKICGTAAVLAATAVTGFAYTTPFSYVSIDVNPSVEYSLNRFDRVISVTAVNDDGEKIVDGLNVKNEKISRAVQITIDKLKEEGYLTDEEYAGIVIAVSNDNEDKAEDLKKDLEEDFDKEDEEKRNDEEEEKEEENDEKEVQDKKKDKKDTDEKSEEDNVDLDIVIEAVGRERVKEARKLNVTPGKLNLVQKLIHSLNEDDIEDIDEEDLQEYLKMSVKEINKTIKENRKSLEDIIEDDDMDETEIKEKDSEDEAHEEYDDDDEYDKDDDDEDGDDEDEDEEKVNNKKPKKDKKNKNK